MRVFKLLVMLLLVIFISAVFLAGFNGNISSGLILETFDEYMRLVLTSWPAAILVIILTALILQHEAVAYFIKNRMTGVGPDGIKGALLETTATDIEVNEKTIREEKEIDKIDKELEKKKNQKITLNANYTLQSEDILQSESNSSNKRVYDRLVKVTKIEGIVQASLMERYGEKYRPQVKLAIDTQKPLIVDGLLYGKKGNKATAVEIKHISSKSAEALPYILRRKLVRLVEFGIRRMVVILVMDKITTEDAVAIESSCRHLAKIYFYEFKNESLKEVKIPSRDESFF